MKGEVYCSKGSMVIMDPKVFRGERKRPIDFENSTANNLSRSRLYFFSNLLYDREGDRYKPCYNKGKKC